MNFEQKIFFQPEPTIIYDINGRVHRLQQPQIRFR